VMRMRRPNWRSSKQRDSYIFFIQENKHVISWCFSLLSFHLCQILSITFGPVNMYSGQ
jgi:hypothetical protein